MTEPSAVKVYPPYVDYQQTKHGRTTRLSNNPQRYPRLLRDHQTKLEGSRLHSLGASLPAQDNPSSLESRVHCVSCPSYGKFTGSPATALTTLNRPYNVRRGIRLFAVRRVVEGKTRRRRRGTFARARAKDTARKERATGSTCRYVTPLTF